MSIRTTVPNLERERQQLRDLAHLDADWDSYGAEPISDASIALANRLMEEIATRYYARPDDLYPLNSGGVQIEWRENATLFAVEIHADVPFHYLLVSERGERHQSVEEHQATFDEVMQAAATSMHA